MGDAAQGGKGMCPSSSTFTVAHGVVYLAPSVGVPLLRWRVGWGQGSITRGGGGRGSVCTKEKNSIAFGKSTSQRIYPKQHTHEKA